MSYKIVIDDERTFTGPLWDAVHLRTPDAALAELARVWTRYYSAPEGAGTRVEELYLDHDLGPEGDIQIVVDFLVLCQAGSFQFPVDAIFVHSQNPAGADRMVRSLARGFPSVKRIPLPPLVP